MTNTKEEHKTKNLKEIEELIARAIKKVGGSKENDICKYIPMQTGGYIHHFTMRKMKNKQPTELGTLIEKFIIKSDRPSSVPPKTRAARGSRKRRDGMSFSRLQLERMLQLARMSGDKEMVSILSPKKSLATAKRELIASIRHTEVDPELWNIYVEIVQAMNASVNQENKSL
jgi:hypothetical protein